MTRSRTNFRPRGFTLLELLVVGMVGTLLLLFIASATRWYGRSMQATKISMQLTRELKLAAEAIAQDFGPSLAARTVDGTTLQMDTDAGVLDGVPQWAAPDAVVEYAVQSNRLIRRDLVTGDEVPLADHISNLEAEVVDGMLEVRLTASLRKAEHSITFQMVGS